MSLNGHPKQGDVYWIDPNPASQIEQRSKHRFVIITPQEINALGVSFAVPIMTSKVFLKRTSTTVPVNGYHTTGVAVCNQIRSFDVKVRVKLRKAAYIETLSPQVVSEIINRVLKIIET